MLVETPYNHHLSNKEIREESKTDESIEGTINRKKSKEKHGENDRNGDQQKAHGMGKRKKRSVPLGGLIVVDETMQEDGYRWKKG